MTSVFSLNHLSTLGDILIVAGLFWVGISWLKNTRARLALPGIVILGGLYFLARLLDFQLTTYILQGFFAAFVLVIVVVFQEDLRRLFEGITVLSLRRHAPLPSSSARDILVRTLTRLARERVGALIVMPGREPLERHLDGGIYLHGQLSEPLLLSLFDSHSPGHDGAVLLRGNTVLRFAVHLPLSTELEASSEGGTRHAAALGLAERTDALCIAVSEERGTISIARDGKLQRLKQPEALNRELARFLEETSPASKQSEKQSIGRRVATHWQEGVLAIALATAVWYLFVPGMAITEVARSIPVSVENMPEGYTLVETNPPKVDVTFRGKRRDLILANPTGFEIHLDALLVQFGRRTFHITPEIIDHPENLVVVSTDPNKVRLTVTKNGQADPK